MKVVDERVPVLVIGGGQAGLATSYELKRRDVRHVVLEAAACVGDSWRKRWDSLRLFTPAQYDGLPGMAFPGGTLFPTKDDMASYLETYVAAHELPVRTGIRVDRLARSGSAFVVSAGAKRIEAREVVVATGAYQTARVPAFAGDLDRAMVQLHASEYRRPADLREGPVLVVGAGNSGAELAIESAAAGHQTYLAGRSTGEVPAPAYALGGRPFWFFANHVLSVKTPIGRRIRPHVIASGGPLIRLRMKDVEAAGVERVGRVVGARGGRPVIEGDRALEVANVVWCTGFGRDFSWIELPVFDGDGMPRHRAGAAVDVNGLYFVGLPFLTKLASAFIGGVGSDARKIAAAIADRERGSGAAAVATDAGDPVRA